MRPLTRRGLARLIASLALLQTGAAHAQGPAEVSLFRVVGPRDEVTIGFTRAEIDRLGAGPDVERIARALVAQGQVTAWQYMVTRAPEGGTRLATSRRIAILRNDTLRIEPYAAALPVAPPPAGP
jgi:hypothetical protein